MSEINISHNTEMAFYEDNYFRSEIKHLREAVKDRDETIKILIQLVTKLRGQTNGEWSGSVPKVQNKGDGSSERGLRSLPDETLQALWDAVRWGDY